MHITVKYNAKNKLTRRYCKLPQDSFQLEGELNV